MFFANAFKDYADQLNDLALLFNDNFTVFTFLKFSLAYILDSGKVVLVYIFSGQWLTAFLELPCSLSMNYRAILDKTSLFETAVNPTFFQFLEPPLALKSNLFLTGFFNSFFLTLPLSVAHLLTLRAFFINGLHAGAFAAAGTIIGQTLFFTGVLFGLESFFLPFLTWEPLNYTLGCILIVNQLYKMIHNPTMEVLNYRYGKNSQLFLNFFGLNFLLAWTEQASCFQYFGNLTVGNLPTVLNANLDNGSANGFLSFVLPNSFYLGGIFLGSVLWTLAFAWLFTLIRSYVSRVFQLSFMFFNEKFHHWILIGTFTLCLTSIPYYGFDYLISAPLGFLSQDKGLEFFKAKSYNPTMSLNKEVLVESYINPIPFDRPSQMESVPITTSSPLINTFEDGALDCEVSWQNRDALSSRQIRLDTSKKSSGQKGVDEKVIQENVRFCKKFYQAFDEKAYDSTSFLDPTNFLDKEALIDDELFKVTTASDEKDKLEDDFLDDSLLDPRLRDAKKKRTKEFPRLESDIDHIADMLFSPTAFQYYNEEGEATYSYATRQQFRERFYKNPVYKVLTHLDMVSFLQGQSTSSKLTQTDEELLTLKQKMLQNYLTSLTDYKTFVTKKQTSSAYGSKLYNQQFKGSLDLVRNYFSISLGSPSTLSIFPDGKVLKFDMLLYKTTDTEINPFLHEELKAFVLEKDTLDPTFFKQEDVDSTPFYIGWDSSLRKFLVKNSCIPGMPFGNQAFSSVVSGKDVDNQKPTYLSFQAWPFEFKNIKKLTNQGVSLPYTPLSDDKALKVAEFLGIQTKNFKKADLNEKMLLLDKNLPNYDWRSLNAQSDKKESLPDDFASEVELKNLLPAQLSGFSWPGARGLTKALEMIQLKQSN